MRPVIGITTYRERARWGSWEEPAVLVPAEYADAVAGAGGEPVLLPTGATSPAVLDALDGLVLAGGADVDPARYGAPADPATTEVRPDRDAAEVAALQAALDRGLPVLAICRGMQLLNVVLGGDLVQHLPDLPGAAAHQEGPGRYARRLVRTAEDSRARAALGVELAVPCHHHQACGRLAPPLVATAWAEDGTVEAVEGAGPGFLVGVQWHPEAAGDLRLFTALAQAAATRQAAASLPR